MLHRLFCIFLLLLLNKYSTGQDCNLSISGFILDEHDKSPLDYSTVYIPEIENGAAADENGYFIIDNLCAGKYSFIINHIGCNPDTIKIELFTSITKDFFLEHHAEELAELIKIASKIKNENSQTTSEINEKELAQLEGKDLGSILSTIAGVNQLKTGTTISKPIIHGLYGDRISIINNGVKLESQSWGTEHAPEIDPFTSNNIKIIKGIGTLEYSTDAMSGMVVMEPPVLRKNKHLSASLSLIGQTNGRGITTSARIEQGFKKHIAYFIQGTYKRSGDQQAPQYNLTNTGIQEGNFSTGFGILKNNWNINLYYSMFKQHLGILRSAHIGNLTDLQNAIDSDTPLIIEPFSYTILNPKQKTIHHFGKVNINKYFDNQSHLDLIYSFQLNNRKEFDIRRVGRSTTPALNMNLLSNNLLISYNRKKIFTKTKSSLESKSGINILLKQNVNNPETGVRPLIPDYYQYSFGVFDLEKFSIKNFILEFGGRYEYTRFNTYKFDKNNVLQKPIFNYHTYAFNVGGSWKNTTENIQVQTNISYNSRFPNASELFSEGLHHSIASLEFGNDSLKPERGIKWINTISTNYKKYIQAEVSFYISKINDFIYLAPLPEPILTIRGAFPAFQYYQTNARLLGLDVTINSEPTSFLSLSLRSSIIRGKNTKENDHLIYMPSDRISAAFDIHHDFKKVQNVHFGMNVQHVFFQKRTPTQITEYKAIPNAYTTLNASAGFDFLLHSNHKLSFSITGENITNAVYRDYLNRFRYYSDESGWNLIFRLKYTFS